jgi:hypothetical protein
MYVTSRISSQQEWNRRLKARRGGMSALLQGKEGGPQKNRGQMSNGHFEVSDLTPFFKSQELFGGSKKLDIPSLAMKTGDILFGPVSVEAKQGQQIHFPAVSHKKRSVLSLIVQATTAPDKILPRLGDF